MVAKKYLTAFFASLILICVLQCSAFAEYSLEDRAELFYPSEEKNIVDKMKTIDQEFHMNVLVLTTDDARGKTPSEYMEDRYEELEYEKNNARGGIALIIDMDNREVCLVTERDMIYYITDAREETIYDAGFEYLPDGEYGKCMNAMLNQVIRDLRSGIPGNQYIYDTETGKSIRYRSITGADIMIALIGALTAAVVVCLVLYREYSVVKKFRYSANQNAEIRITNRREQLVNQYVTQRKIPRNPPSGSGGSSGRTSTHRSSGGHSYGGGHGRKF